MSFDHFENLLIFAAAGLGLLLAGGLNLALGLGGRRVLLRLIVTPLLCGAVLGGLVALARPELAVRSASVLVGVLALAAVLGSDWFTRRLVSLIAFVHGPAPRWGLVALGGLGLIVGSGIAFDRADEEIIEQTEHDLSLASGFTPMRPTERAHATTDHGTPIVLKEPIAPRDPNELNRPEEDTLHQFKYREQLIRHGTAGDETNCHGWVFTGGRFLLSPTDVETILKENGYHEVHDPLPGDLVIYRQGGSIAHSAVVRYVAEGQPVLIEGKWGAMGLFLHAADKSIYGTEYTFHRSARPGHLLLGIGGSSSPNAIHGGAE